MLNLTVNNISRTNTPINLKLIMVNVKLLHTRPHKWLFSYHGYC